MTKKPNPPTVTCVSAFVVKCSAHGGCGKEFEVVDSIEGNFTLDDVAFCVRCGYTLNP